MIRSRYIAAITDKPWWLAGGISAANCVAAFQPIGAASYAASKVNLANPGTHDAVDGADYPTWNATDGWIGDGTGKYLQTDIVPSDLNWSVALRYSGKSNETKYIAGCYNYSVTNRRFGFYSDGVSLVYGMTQNVYSYSGVPLYGVAILAGFDVYFNGSYVDSIAEGSNNTSGLFAILARHNSGSIDLFSAAKVQAISVYSAKLTSDQAAALSTAMAAL